MLVFPCLNAYTPNKIVNWRLITAHTAWKTLTFVSLDHFRIREKRAVEGTVGEVVCWLAGAAVWPMVPCRSDGASASGGGPASSGGEDAGRE